MTQTIEAFFQAFEAAGNKGDAAASGKFFGEVFLHGDPEKVQTVKNEDFVKALPMRQAFFAKLGIGTSRVKVIEQIPLNPQYTLVKTEVTMQFNKDGQPRQIDQTANYIVKHDGDTMHIVVYINDQLLNTLLIEQGLIEPAS